MLIVTPEQMKKIETQSEKLGVMRSRLMENAGAALADITDEYCRNELEGRPEEKSVVFLAGSGNNGGDCFVAAYKLVYRGYDVTVINFCGKPQTDIAMEQFEKLPKDHVKIIKAYRSENVKAAIEAAELSYMTLPQENDLNTLAEKKELTPLDKIRLGEKKRIERVIKALANADVIVDGIFGTGFHGQLDEEIAVFLRTGSHAYRIAVDVPSGGNSGSGDVSEGTFDADETIALGALKTGLTQYPLKEYCGRIRVVDIGIPEEAFEVLDDENELHYKLMDSDETEDFPKKRRPAAHKGDFGRVLIIAGSSRMRGAAVLASAGALRSGAGLVTAASCEKCVDAVAAVYPEAVFLPLECDDYGFMLYDSNKKLIEEALEKSNAVLIGCGMGVTADTAELTRFVIENSEIPVILDADGINCIVTDIDILLKKKTNVILTPHTGEMARLAGISIDEVNGDRFAAAQKLAEKYDVTVMLKGPGTIVAGGGRISVNSTGNPGMSRGGSGDVLAGITASFAAQGHDLFDAARFAAYVHGLAGDIAAENYGHEAMIPRDLVNALSDSFRLIKNKINK